MKTKHTKGEWVAKPNPSDAKKHGIWSQHPTRGTSLIAMAQMDFMTEEELKENAKLIAAAPELLEALEMAVNILECKHGFHKKFDNTRSIEEMKSAIAKATNQKIEA